MTSVEEGNKRLIEALIGHLDSSYIYLGPFLMTLAMITGYISTLTSKEVSTLLVPIAVSLGVIGGYLEFHTLIVLMRARDILLDREPSLIKYIGRAAILTGFYYSILGSLIIASTVKDIIEHVREKPIQDLACRRYYNYIYLIISLGAALSPLQACISRDIRDLLLSSHIFVEELPEGFGAHA